MKLRKRERQYRKIRNAFEQIKTLCGTEEVLFNPEKYSQVERDKAHNVLIFIDTFLSMWESDYRVDTDKIRVYETIKFLADIDEEN